MDLLRYNTLKPIRSWGMDKTPGLAARAVAFVSNNPRAFAHRRRCFPDGPRWDTAINTAACRRFLLALLNSSSNSSQPVFSGLFMSLKTLGNMLGSNWQESADRMLRQHFDYLRPKAAQGPPHARINAEVFHLFHRRNSTQKLREIGLGGKEKFAWPRGKAASALTLFVRRTALAIKTVHIRRGPAEVRHNAFPMLQGRTTRVHYQWSDVVFGSIGKALCRTSAGPRRICTVFIASAVRRTKSVKRRSCLARGHANFSLPPNPISRSFCVELRRWKGETPQR